MERRDFLKGAAWTVGAGISGLRSVGAAAAPVAHPPAPAASPAEFVTLREGVGHFTARGGTIGWLVNEDVVLAVDTQFPDTAARFVADLPGRRDRRFHLVLNTHHHGDHTGGNAVLRQLTPTLLAHQHVPGLMRDAAARAQREVEPAMLPNSTTAGETVIGLGEERVRLDYFGPAHTKGDLVITFERANVVHTGDLVFNRLYPVIDRPAGASIRNWIVILERMAREYSRDTLFVFGHGKPGFGVTGNRGDLLVFRDYLAGLLDYTERQIRAGMSRERVSELENLPGFPDFHAPPPNRLGANLAVAYDELTAQ